MTHERRLPAGRAEDRLLERKDDRHPVRIPRQLACTTPVPRPYLRGDVVEHAHPPFVRRAREPQIEAGIIDRDHEVRRIVREADSQAAEKPDEERDTAGLLREAHDGKPVEIRQQPHSRGGHARSAQTVQFGVGPPRPQCADQRRPVHVAGRIPRGEEDARSRHAQPCCPSCQMI